MPHELAPEHALRPLCRALGLPYEQHEWGLVNADARRIFEFITYYEAHPALGDAQRRALVELILASANEHLASGAASLPAAVPAFLQRNRSLLSAQLQHWRNLRDRVQFPLASWLREYSRETP